MAEDAREHRKFPSFVLAFTELTNLRMPEIHPDAGVVRRSLYWYPLAGLYLGIASAALPIFFASYFSLLQAFVLFSGCIYVFLAAWLSGFSGYRDLCRFSDALALRHISQEERRKRLTLDAPGAAGVAACSILAASKVLIVYLLFTRLALFDKTMLLAFFLGFAPFGARLTLLACTVKSAAPEQGDTSIAGKGRCVPLLFLIALVCVGGWLFLTCAQGFGEFFLLQSPETTMHNLSVIHAFGKANPAVFIVFLLQGGRDMFFLFAGAFLAFMYTAGEARTYFGGMTKEAAGAAAEIAEFALLASALLAADYMLV